jgi:hypothetical protein
MPLLWATPRPGDETDSVSVQTARFRAPRDSLDLVVSAALPIARLLGDVGRRISVDVGLTMLSPTATIAMRDSTRLRIAREDAEFESTRSWRGRLGAGAYDYRVEGYGVASHREARAAATMAPRATAGFGTSDLLVAASVTRPPGVARRWSDFSTVPNGGVFRRGAPVALLWETYALAAGADSISRYRVTLSVVPLGAAAAGPSLAARVFAGAMGRGTRSIARSALAYERQVPATPWSVDYLSLDLSGAPPGAYVVRVTVEDAISKQSTTTSARIRVVE